VREVRELVLLFIPWWRLPRPVGLSPEPTLQELFERYPFATTVEARRQLLPMFIKNSDRTGIG